jgi:protein phosphatase
MAHEAADHANSFAMTHIGKVRTTNEDRYLIKKFSDGSLLMAVADGLGRDGLKDCAADIIIENLSRIDRIENGREHDYLVYCIKETDVKIRQQVRQDVVSCGIGTTIICVLLKQGCAYWVHAGDSRLYLFRDGGLIQITNDQTLSRFLLEEGEISLEQIPQHYSRHVMDQYVGCGYCEPESGEIIIKTGDTLLLASDGLHHAVGSDIISSILTGENDIPKKAGSLIAAALDAGGTDNITVVLSDCSINP